jgi:hypothetical protein
MKIAIFSFHQFERKSLEKANTENYELIWVEEWIGGKKRQLINIRIIYDRY